MLEEPSALFDWMNGRLKGVAKGDLAVDLGGVGGNVLWVRSFTDYNSRIGLSGGSCTR